MKKIMVVLVMCASLLPAMAGGGALLDVADDLYSRLAFTKAAEYYQKYLVKNEDDVYAWQQLAACYDMTNDYDNLEATLEKLSAMEGVEDPAVFLSYAEVLQIKGKYAEAATYYQKYLDVFPEDRRAANQRNACLKDPGLKGDGELVRYRVENMPFNTDAFEFAPNLFNRTLLYTSTSEDHNYTNKVFGWTGGSYSDLKQYERDTTEVFVLLNEMEKLNTTYNDGPFTLDPVTEDFYYTRNNFDRDKAFNKKGINAFNYMNLKIYIAENNLGKIGKVTEFAYNSPDYNTGHPTISPDGKYLVFVSDQPEGNIGGRDLYVCVRDSASWGEPQLLTADINTEGDELFPYFHADGSLYFASDGWGSVGGLDIYRAEVDLSANQVKSMEHLGPEINTSYDDFGIVFKDAVSGYFTSDRITGNGKDDIYEFEDMTVLLIGTVVNAETGELLPGSDFSVSNDGNTVISGQTNEMASFETLVYKDRLYEVFADEDYFHDATVEVSTVGIRGDKPVRVKVELVPIHYTVKVIDATTGEPIRGANVDMDFGCNRTPASVVTATGGVHRIPVYKTCDYAFMAKARGYLAKDLAWTSPAADEDQEIVIALDPISYEPIALRSIYYDFDKSNLRLAESTKDLERLLKFLNDNPELTIQINSHTDARATAAYNIRLSQRRAQSVVDWLKLRGVKEDRIVAIGYGETAPVNGCVDGVKCSEEEHQLNRRTEFQVVNKDGTTKIASDAREDIKVDPCKNCPF